MIKKIFAVFLVCILIILSFSGCSNALKESNASLNSELTSIKQKNSELEKKVSDLTSENQKLNDQIKALESNDSLVNESMAKSKDNVYPVCTANSDTYEKEVHLWIYIDEKSSIKNKLEVLSKTLSKVYFGDLPIEVSQIKDVDGKKVAVINLKESSENQKIKEASNFKSPSWALNYFQGSAGGSMTTASLVETILQRDYKGSWIDGVVFKYNNQTIEYEHVPDLNKIIYR
jgi:septal ring factor EnvC (AmiA/AmiB activator)